MVPRFSVRAKVLGAAAVCAAMAMSEGLEAPPVSTAVGTHHSGVTGAFSGGRAGSGSEVGDEPNATTRPRTGAPSPQPPDAVDPQALATADAVDPQALATADASGEGLPFDLGAVVEQVHFAFRADGDDPRVQEGGHSTYAVRVERGAFEVRPFHDPSGQPEGASALALPSEVQQPLPTEFPDASTVVEGEPATFETIAMGRGESAGDVAAVRDPVTVSADDGHLMLTRPGHVEHLRNGRDGVEQSWEFSARPSGRGDLVVRVAAQGLPLVASTDGGLHFADASGLGVRYGHAVWVAADGTRTPVPASYRGGAIELRVPGNVVDDSAYPAVLDPVVGPEFGIDAPAWAPAANNQERPRIKWSGFRYLVVWQDRRGGEYDIYGTRLTYEGLVEDPAGVVISNASQAQQMPAVSWNGSDFLVVWHDSRSGTSWDIYGTLVSESGAVQTPAGVPISTAGNHQQYPAIVASGPDFLVVWQDIRGGGSWDIYGSPVSSAGVVQDASGFVVSNAVGHQELPSLVFTGATYMVVWQDQRNGNSDVYGARVTTEGTVEEPSGFVVSNATGNQESPSISLGNMGCLVAWQDQRTGTDWDVYASRVTREGVVEDTGGIVISNATNFQQAPSITSTGTGFLVVWQDLRNGAPFEVHGARVNDMGEVQDPNGYVISQEASHAMFPTVVTTPNGHLVAWQSFRDSEWDVYASLLTTEGDVQDGSALLVSDRNNNLEAPAVASNGSEYLVVWQDRRSGTAWDVYGTRVSSSGELQDPNGILISGAADDQSYPQVASNGSDYLVVWHDLRDGGSTDLYGARVTSAGQAQDAGGVVITNAVNDQALPAVASNGTDYLVVWMDLRSGVRQDIYGARVTSLGDVQEPNGFVVSDADIDQVAPAVASNGSDYLVAWHDYRNGTIADVYGARVTAEGVTEDPNGIVISNATNEQRNPAVASNGSDYLVVWDDTRSGGMADVYGARVTPQGVVQDTSGIEIGNTVSELAYPRAVSNGSGYFVVWHEQRPSSPSNVLGARVTSAGALRETGFMLTTNVDPWNRAGLATDGTGDALVVVQRQVGYVSRAFGRLITLTDANGVACTAGSTCTSGNCVDGVCCDTACGGGDANDCQACSAALTGGTQGVCAPSTEGSACGDATTTACNAADTCDESGACVANLAIEGSACGDESSTTCTAPDTCNALGACQANDAEDDTPCEAELYCASGDTCAAGMCVEGTALTCTGGDKCSETNDECYPACGDGVPDAGEECDNGGQNSNTMANACRTTCELAECGDGVVDTGEGCDDGAGNSDAPGAACRTTCALATCGDEVLDPGEECDEGSDNSNAPDAQCRPTCTEPACGDGVTDSGEACDDGPSNSDVVANACRTTCEQASCGDGVTDTGEACDDGSSGSATCTAACALVLVDGGVDDGGMEDGGSEPDAGPDPDGGTRNDMGDGSTSGGGCGCSVPSRSEAPTSGGLALLALLAAVVTRRRRRS